VGKRWAGAQGDDSRRSMRGMGSESETERMKGKMSGICSVGGMADGEAVKDGGHMTLSMASTSALVQGEGLVRRSESNTEKGMLSYRMRVRCDGGQNTRAGRTCSLLSMSFFATWTD